MRNLAISLLVCSLFLVGISVSAQSDEWYNITSFEYISAIHDEENHAWIASNGGLCHLDKLTGEKTYYNQANSGLPANGINDIYKASNGDLWVSHLFGVGTFNNAEYEPVEGLTTGNIAEDSSGNIYVAANYSLQVYDQSEVLTYDYPFNNAGQAFISISEEPNTVLVSLTNWFEPSGLLVWDNGEWQTFEDESSFWIQGYYYESMIFTASNNDYWYHTSESIWHYTGDAWEEIPMTTFGNDYCTPIDIIENGEGTVLFLYNTGEGSKILKWDNGEWELDIIMDENGEVFNNPTYLCAQSNGKYWLGSSTDNLFEWDTEELSSFTLKPDLILRSRFYQIEHDNGLTYIANSDEFYLAQNNNWDDLLSYPNAPMQVQYFAIDSAGMIHTIYEAELYSWDGNEWSSSTMPESQSYPLRSIQVDQAGNIWAIWNNKIWRYDGAWTAFTTADHGIGGSVLSLQVDINAGIWAGGLNGLARFDGGEWSLLQDFDEVNTVVEITQANDGKLWLCTTEHLHYLENGEFTKVDIFNGENLYNAKLLSTSNGELFISNYNILRKVVNNEIAQEFEASTSGLPAAYIRDLSMDTYNNLWISTYTNGIGIYNPEGVDLGSLGVFNFLTNKPNRVGMNIYPNPVSPNTSFSIDIDGENHRIEDIKIWGMNGRQQKFTVVNSTYCEAMINIGNWPEGIYLVQVLVNGQWGVAQLVVK